MNKVNIQFGGMANIPDESVAQDGQMAVLMNMRHKGGELVNSLPPSSFTGLGKVEQMLYHNNSKRWLALNNGVIKVYKENYSADGAISAEGVKSFALLGNIVVMYYEDQVLYAIWNGNTYLSLGEAPETPTLKYSMRIGNKYFETEGSNLNDVPDSSNYNYKHQKGNVDKTLAYIYENKGYVDRAWFRLGIRLFDGSYFSVSNIYELSRRPNEGKKDAYGYVTEKIIGVQQIWETVSLGTYFTDIEYFVPSFEVEVKLGDWRDLIASVDLFTTGSIMSHAVGTLTDNEAGQGVPAGIEIYKERTPEQLKEAIIQAEFYKIAEYDADGNLTWSINNTSPSNIAVQDILGDVSLHTVLPYKPIVFNNRIHACGCKELFFKGFSSAVTSYYGMSGKDVPWTVYVHIKTDDGFVVVRRDDIVMEQAFEHLYYFSYPDNRAFQMDVFRDDDEFMSFALSPHPRRNEAFFLKTTEVEVVLNGDTPNELSYYVPVIVKEEWRHDGVRPNVGGFIDSKQILKVSAVDNPFYFPTAQTYKFDGEIKGLASNAEAISQGQFGQYPLFVFTTEGIWAMQVDSTGKGAYTTQTPFSREVCNGGVCPVSGGIIFTTDRGVMAISGNQVTEISAPLDGESPDYISPTSIFKEIYRVGEFSTDNLLVPDNIRTYIKGAKIAYNYLHNEVILSNANYGYSLVYKIDSQRWSMIDCVFDVTTNSYPELVVYNNKMKRVYTFDDRNKYSYPLAITRPFTLGTTGFKRLRQAALRYKGEGHAYFYVLGSNDGREFVCLTGKEFEGRDNEGIKNYDNRDLVTPMSRSRQCKYFAIAVALPNFSGSVSLAELLVDAGLANNKLR